MSVKVKINVPDIATTIASYDVIRLYRSDSTRDGPFTEVTAATAGAATILGNVVETFTSLNGKTLILRLATKNGTRPDVSVTFTDANPITAAQAAASIAAAAPALFTASNDGGYVRITSVDTGPSVKLTVVGGSGLADLGLALYTSDVGEDPFITLMDDETDYEFYDPEGTVDSWYRWQFYNTGTMGSSAVTSAIQPRDYKVDATRKNADVRSTKSLTLIRGREHTFYMAFWEDQESGIPVVPFNASRFPNYVITDPDGTIIQKGRAEIDGSVPNYKVLFTPPQNAKVTNDDRPWRIDWYMLSETGRSVQASNLFDMRDVDIIESEVHEELILALETAPKRLRLVLEKRPVSITMQVTKADSGTDTILELPAVYPPSGPNPSLTEITDGDRYLYYYDLDANTLVAGNNGNKYNIFWTVLSTPTAEEDNIVQVVAVPPVSIFQYMKSLRMGIDKFQKKYNQIQAYQESDLYEYLTQGLQLINGMSPAHLTWTLSSIPSVVVPYWLMSAMWWGLNAQQGLEIDLAFSFTGQSVTLDYDHAAALDGLANKMIDAVRTQFGPLKLQMYRRSASAGSYSGRALRRSGVNNYVFQISHDRNPGGINFLALLTQIGLI